MAEVNAIRVLLVDDHAMLRQCLRSTLKACPNIAVVGEASDGDEALLCVANLQPAVVVMDINMPRMDGITATRLIKEQYSDIAVIGLSFGQEQYQISAMQKAGALHVIAKENAQAELCSAIERAVIAVQPVVTGHQRLPVASLPFPIASK